MVLVGQSICIEMARVTSRQLGRAAECRGDKRIDVGSNLRYLFEGKIKREEERPLIVQPLAGSFSRSALGQMQGAPNEYVGAFAQWLPVETLHLFEGTQRLDHGKNYDLSCAAGIPGSVKSDRIFAIVQSIRHERRALRIEERFTIIKSHVSLSQWKSHPTSIHNIALVCDSVAVIRCQKQYHPGHIVRHYFAF